MAWIDYLREKDVSAGGASLTVAATLCLFGVLFLAIWVLLPLLMG